LYLQASTYHGIFIAEYSLSAAYVSTERNSRAAVSFSAVLVIVPHWMAWCSVHWHHGWSVNVWRIDESTCLPNV